MRKSLCASLNLLLTKFLKRLNSLHVLLSGHFSIYCTKNVFGQSNASIFVLKRLRILKIFSPFFNSLNWCVF